MHRLTPRPRRLHRDTSGSRSRQHHRDPRGHAVGHRDRRRDRLVGFRHVSGPVEPDLGIRGLDTRHEPEDDRNHGRLRKSVPGTIVPEARPWGGLKKKMRAQPLDIIEAD